MLSIFHPELLGITGAKTIVTQIRPQSHCEDPLDAEYLRETSVSSLIRGDVRVGNADRWILIVFLRTQRRSTKESLDITGEPLPEGSAGIAPPQIAGEEELAVEVEGTQPTNSTSDFITESGQPVGIDNAIVRCIERYGMQILLFTFFIPGLRKSLMLCNLGLVSFIYRHRRTET